MTIRRRRWAPAALLLTLSTASACPGDTTTPSTPSDETGGEDTDAAQCDPEGAQPEMGMLLNAPVEADVEVIQKQPQHPGVPGPLELP